MNPPWKHAEEVTQKKKPQLFSMTPRPLHPDTANDEWEMHTEGLTEKVNLRCLKLLDRSLELQRCREPDRPKKDDYDYDGMNEREINLRLFKALEKNNKIAKYGPPGSSPPSSSSSSSGDSDTRSDRAKKNAKKVKKDHLKTHPKSVKEKDLKLPSLPETPEFDLWKDRVYHKIVTAAQRGSINHPWTVKIEKPEVTFDNRSDTEGYDMLDAALCCAIFEVAKGELSGTLTLKSRELRSQGHLLTGRQALSWCTRSSPSTKSAARSTTSATSCSPDSNLTNRRLGSSTCGSTPSRASRRSSLMATR